METSFVFIFTFLLMQRFGTSIAATPSNVTCIEGERRSLLAIKHKITDRFNLLSTWSGVGCCDWRGIGCDSRNGHVVKLDLRSATFPAPIVDDLRWVSSLSSLRYLDLSGIDIGNHIDWFHPVNMLPSLLTLNLASTGITNIPSTQFVNFTSLNSLDLSMNYINSTIPLWLSNLTGLMHLNLHQNKFHGKIPDFIGTFSTLTSIDLSYNSFDTSMPDLLCNLSSLVHLDLSYNMFSGPVPSNIGLLLRLEYLNLRYNHLNDPIPASLGLFSKLKKLDVSGNSLVGVLSETHFTNLKNLIHLDLSLSGLALNFSSPWIPPFQLQTYAKLSGRLPECLGNLSGLLAMDLSIPSSLGSLTKLMTLHLHNNRLEGNLPLSLQNLTRLVTMDIGYNFLVGDIPFWIGENLSRLTILNLQSNKFTAVVFAVVRGRQAVFVEPLSLSFCRPSIVVEPFSYAIIRIERLIQFVVVISVCTVETIDWRKLWNRLLWEVIYQQHP
ncbi:hypothetical protein E3N88_37747 [Mikania micrantha]|uniref:Leucine-rich repeat-containing N-terminal plant-type domain-containing protein n=1 Tax=Mikania micrantha TaxID=192012 RepID=A0A5N6LS80_9ASTR|nr:hypothetical protein E3N88_37747 [Mikania micrantha]